jgi:hypothetical protein
MPDNYLHNVLRDRISGAIARGEATPIVAVEDEAIANGVCGIGTEDDDDRPPTFEEDPSFYIEGYFD